jgi:hypothetical protein
MKRTTTINVIPAKAGIHRRASARNKTHALAIASRWIPAFAGMTMVSR